MGDDIEAKKKKLKEELDQLKIELKVEIPKRLTEARAYGDLRENAEYDAAKERQAFVNARINQISSQISELRNLKLADIQRDRIGFGSMVRLRDVEEDAILEFTFVSSNEVKPSEGKISLSSPFGMALQNRFAGDIVEVNIPAGKRRYLVEKLTTIHGDVYEHRPE